MTWKDKLRPAKFRDVPFFVPSIEHSGGRRSIVHLFPGRETGYTEDMGKAPRHFTVEGYVVASPGQISGRLAGVSDYMGMRDNLLNALETPGVGKLVHPYFGEIDVQAGGYTVREIQDEGGIARFTMSFDDVGSVAYPSAATNTEADTYTKKGNAVSGAQAYFAEAYAIASAPYAVTQNALRTADDALAYVAQARKTVAKVAAFERDIDNIRGKGIQGILSVQGLSSDIVRVLTYGTSREDAVAGGESAAYDQFVELLLYARNIVGRVPLLSADDPSGRITDLSQQTAIASAAGMLTVVPFSNTAEARETGQTLLDQIDYVLENTLSDQVFSTFSDLRKSVVADINQRALSLPDLVPFTPPGPMNSLALSWRLYGNLDGEDDIIARNKISNPGFIPSGAPLEVLTDAG